MYPVKIVHLINSYLYIHFEAKRSSIEIQIWLITNIVDIKIKFDRHTPAPAY